MTLYVAIIGLGTLAGILFNVLINKRLIFRILGIIITLVTGTFACLVVLFPYFFFSSYNNLFIKLSLTAVLLIIIYVSARMIVNACSSVKKAEDKKDVHKAEPAASEIAIADHALMNKVKSIISADKTPAKSLTQKVSVKLDDASPKLAAKEIKEIIPGRKSAEPDAGVYNGQPDKLSFGQALKDADDKILADSQYAKSGVPVGKAVAAEIGTAKKTDMQEPAVKQGLVEYKAEPSVKPEKAAGKKAETAAESKLGIQYEEPADMDKKAEEKIVKSGAAESVLGIQYEQPEEEAAAKEAVQAAAETIPEPQNTQAAEQAAAIEEAEQAAAESEPETQAAQTAETAEMPGEKEKAATAVEAGEKADPGSAKFMMIISKARELMEQEKYVYAAELIQMCHDRSEDVAVKKQADILMIECLALSDRKSEAQEKWIEFLNKKYILDEADKNKLKQVMRSLQG